MACYLGTLVDGDVSPYLPGQTQKGSSESCTHCTSMVLPVTKKLYSRDSQGLCIDWGS